MTTPVFDETYREDRATVAKPRIYLTRLWREEALLANWPPDKVLTPGDIVTRDANGTVSVETNIQAVAAQVGETLPSMTLDTRTASPIESAHAASFTAATQGASVVGSLDVTFSRNGGYTLKADAGTVREFATLAPWRSLLQRLDSRARWQRGWQMVTHVRDYERITLIRAASAGQSATVAASIPAEVLGGFTDITAGASATTTSSGCSTWTITDGATLGYEALAVRTKFFQSGVVEGASLYHSDSTLTRRATVEMVAPNWDFAEDE